MFAQSGRNDMNNLGGSTVMVTGGAGMIGSHIVNLLVCANVRVIVYDNFTRGTIANLKWALDNGDLRVINADIRDRIVLDEAMKGVDYIFHLAARRLTRCAQYPREALEVLFDGTFNVLEVAVAHKVRKIVYSSSSSIYGMADQFPIKESHHPYNNTLIYGAGKLAGEMMLRSFYHMYGLDYVALRYFNVYGPHMDLFGAYTEVIPRWLDCIDKGEPPIIYGDGQQTMDLTYVKDVARANVLAMQSDVTDDVFNIATGIETSLNTLALMLVHLTGFDRSPAYKPVERVNVVARRVASIEKAVKELGFIAKVDLQMGLCKMLEWRKEQKGEHQDPVDTA